MGQPMAGATAFDAVDLIRDVHPTHGNREPSGHAGVVRIVAGTAGGRRLVVPEGLTTRPTSDRVREAIFNSLYSLDLIQDRAYCDLFAGSGALGLEALSRGAATATFVERDRSALAALQANIDALGFGQQASIVRADAASYPARGGRFDVVVADPPYEFDAWPELLAGTDAQVVVAESAGPVVAPPGWRSLRERSYGTTVITMLSPETEAP